MVGPRAKAFLAYLEQLVTAVKYVDGIIDPGGNAKITDIGLAESFITKNRPTSGLERDQAGHRATRRGREDSGENRAERT